MLPRMSLRAGCRLISLPAKKELITGSNCSEKRNLVPRVLYRAGRREPWERGCAKRRHGEVLGMQLSKIAGVTDKKVCSVFP